MLCITFFVLEGACVINFIVSTNKKGYAFLELPEWLSLDSDQKVVRFTYFSRLWNSIGYILLPVYGVFAYTFRTVIACYLVSLIFIFAYRILPLGDLKLPAARLIIAVAALTFLIPVEIAYQF